MNLPFLFRILAFPNSPLYEDFFNLVEKEEGLGGLKKRKLQGKEPKVAEISSLKDQIKIDAEIKDGWIEKGMMYCWNENGESLEYKYKNKTKELF